MKLPKPDVPALVAAGIYLIFGGLWIVLSDRMLALMVSDPATLTTYQTYKGGAFVAVMAILAYALVGRLSRQIKALRESEARLAESELRFREMAEHIDQIFYLAAPDYSRFFYVSPAYTCIWGRSVESLLADPASWLAGVVEEDRDRVQAVMADGRDKGFYEDSFRVRRPDGTQRWVHARAYELRDEDGRAYRVAGILEDITGRRQAEEEIRTLARTLETRVEERTAELEQANHELEAFSYSVSHDLRAPLRALNGFAHLVADDPGSHLGPEARTMLGRIRVNADKMATLIDDILAFSRIGRSEMAHVPVDMSALAREVAEELAPEYPTARVAIADMPTVRGDASMLRLVWTNLIGNALKFSSKRAAPAVEAGWEMGGDGQAVFFVHDNGAGFDMAYAQRLFGVFQRLHRNEDFPGTGAGLAITNRIVGRHGGRIWAEAVPDRGATFRFTLSAAGDAPA
ncbi:Phytochrome-like protein cph1 [Rhodocyclaceae bacterium]|nr:Phytochrome-like protein cph1 [Rhodocyclaceae bacterium]